MAEQDYRLKKFNQIVEEGKSEFPKNIALAASWTLADFKGINLKIIDMRETSSLSDYYVIASAENTTTARSMADTLSMLLKRNNLAIRSLEGTEDAEWILIDCSDIIVHIFLESVREIFDLDNLWRENPQIEIPQEYYFSHHSTQKEEETTETYF